MKAPHLHFVTGKGGVGKSTFSLALAEKLAAEGKKTLLVDLADSELFKCVFDLKKMTYEPQKVRNNLFLSYWSGSDCLREYIKYFIKIEALTALFFENPVTRALVNTAPALKELAILGKATSAHRGHGPKFEFDQVVIDSYSTGHFLALLRAPKGMSRIIKKGPMGDQSKKILDVLLKPEWVTYHIVTLSEDLPMKESLELRETLKDEFGIKAQFALNRFINSEFTSSQFKKLNSKSADHSFHKIFTDRLKQQEESLETLRESSKNIVKLDFQSEIDGKTLPDALTFEGKNGF
ncbi:MAG: ArsA-related P-loop ATPase [Bdellovibrionota bacterium]